MGHTLILWSVSLLACPTEGQVAVETPGSKPCASCQAAQAAEAQQNQPSPYYSSPSRGGLLGLGIWDRIRGRFTAGSSRPQQQQNPELGTPIIENGSIAVDMPVIRNAEPPLNSPGAVPASFQSSASAQAPARTAPSTVPVSFHTLPSGPAVQTITPASTVPVKTNGKLGGHEDDYSWVTGYLNVHESDWIIEYATPGTVDQFSGKLVLVNVETSNLQVGDFVCVNGALMTSGGQVIGAYRVTSITLIERSK